MANLRTTFVFRNVLGLNWLLIKHIRKPRLVISQFFCHIFVSATITSFPHETVSPQFSSPKFILKDTSHFGRTRVKFALFSFSQNCNFLSSIEKCHSLYTNNLLGRNIFPSWSKSFALNNCGSFYEYLTGIRVFKKKHTHNKALMNKRKITITQIK